jgi:hypothetical protein
MQSFCEQRFAPNPVHTSASAPCGGLHDAPGVWATGLGVLSKRVTLPVFAARAGFPVSEELWNRNLRSHRVQGFLFRAKACHDYATRWTARTASARQQRWRETDSNFQSGPSVVSGDGLSVRRRTSLSRSALPRSMSGVPCRYTEVTNR